MNAKEEHQKLIEETKIRISKTKNEKTKRQLEKYLHRLYKELKTYNLLRK